MALRIIKQGSARSSNVQQFIFSENYEEMLASSEQSIWPPSAAFDPAPAPKASPDVIPEPQVPAIDVAKLEQAAFDAGYQQGQKAGREIVEQKLEALSRSYSDSLQEIASLKSILRAQVEREVVKLAVAVAKKIVYREIHIDPTIIQTLVKVALSHVTEKSAVTILLNPADYTYLLKQRADLAQSEGRDITFQADNSIQQGGCMIQTECGDIDARIEEKFREVENAFFEGMK